ncbi:hypothetical protein H5410_036916 [Solanum commersonii]|uniref:Uncharacterized protein n=1 Tax=Solanum commersonii TaxID=4109 RepID=A0A9J5Y8S8_SOLCO|nr:hypothetical protein H5410_036916 [Solanum commersonii]
MEEQYEMNNSDHNRILLQKSQADYIKWLKLQDSIVRQKARAKWADRRKVKLTPNTSIVSSEGAKDMLKSLVLRTLLADGGNVGGHLVMKLAMSKAYDKVSWVLLMSLLRSLSSENRSQTGRFFVSCFIIIGVEYLSKALNHLNNRVGFEEIESELTQNLTFGITDLILMTCEL